MKYLREWLHPQRVGAHLHPVRRLHLQALPSAVLDCARGAIENELGGHVASFEPQGGTIDGVFGLIDSERLTLRVRQDEGGSSVTIESRRGAAGAPTRESRYVDALARCLTRRLNE